MGAGLLEDIDLCLKFWTQCGKVMVNPQARVIHIESKTTFGPSAPVAGHFGDQPRPVRRQVGSLVGGSPNPPSGEP